LRGKTAIKPHKVAKIKRENLIYLKQNVLYMLKKQKGKANEKGINSNPLQS
jgi:hypothetical protein